MLRPVLSASLTTLCALAALGQTPSPTPLLQSLTAADLERALPLIRENYLNPSAINETELKRATLAGLIDGLDGGVMLLAGQANAQPSPAPFYREIIDGHIGYLRPGDLSRGQLQELDTTLRSFPAKKIDAVILDLRGSIESSNFALAAQFANRFLPKGQELFSLKGPSRAAQNFVCETAPLYTGLIVVLVDEETAGATEVIAAVLRATRGAIVAGEKTAGRAVNYEDLPLPSGKVLRVAAAEAILPVGQPRLTNGLKPDLEVALAPGMKQQIFQQSLTKGMAPFVFESDRPHLNEAALIAGTNPEIDAQAQRRGKGPEKQMFHDSVLQRGVDLVTSIEVYEQQTGRAP